MRYKDGWLFYSPTHDMYYAGYGNITADINKSHFSSVSSYRDQRCPYVGGDSDDESWWWSVPCRYRKVPNHKQHGKYVISNVTANWLESSIV